MKKFFYGFITITIILMLNSCGDSVSKQEKTQQTEKESIKPDKEYMKSLSGTWEIVNTKYKGSEKEFYKLNSNATMSYYITEQKKTVNNLTKHGDWLAKKDTLLINVKGHSGNIEMLYIFSGNKWRENNNAENTLIRR